MKSRFGILALILILALASGGGLLVSYFRTQQRTEEIRQYLASLAGVDHSHLPPAEEQAREIARLIFTPPAQQDQFWAELLDIYSQAEGKDFLLIYNTGGFGGTSLAEDPEWQGILDGVQSELARLGYTSVMVEHQRGEYTLIGLLKEVKEISVSYTSKAPLLAAKIAFLTVYNPNLRVIITGRSSGAEISNEAMRYLEPYSRVYSIQAGRYFWYRQPAARTLLMDYNGVVPDVLSQGDLLTFLRANLFHLPRTHKPEGGSVKIGPYFFRAPGHLYTWELSGVRSQITAFLQENFGSR